MKEREGGVVNVLCFYAFPYFTVHTKMQVSIQKYAAGAGSLAAGQHTV